MGKRSRRVGIGVLFVLALIAGLCAIRIERRTAPERRTLEASAPAFERPRLSFAPVASTTLSGSVRSRDGRPIPHANVCAVSLNTDPLGSPASPCSQTLADGRYAIDALAAGSYYVRASAFGYVPGVANAGHALALAPELARDDVSFVLERGGANLTGTVIDATGGPVGHAFVRAARLPPPSDLLDAETDDEGRFALTISPGQVALTARAPGYTEAREFPTAPTSQLTLVLTPASMISGLVLSANDRRPIAGMIVTATSATAVRAPSEPSLPTNARGEFSVRGLEAGSYNLSAEGDHLRGSTSQPIEVDVTESASGALILVRPALAVAGRVTIDGSDEACMRGAVDLFPPENSSAALPTLTSPIDARGGVRFAGVPAGDYAVAVRCADHLQVTGPTRIELRDEDLDDVRWRVAPGLGLRVLTVDSRGRAVPYAPLQIEIPQPQGAARGVMLVNTDESGRYDSPSVLEPGRYVVSPNGNQPGETVPVDLAADAGRVTLSLHLRGSAAIVARVRTPAGAPVESVSVVATPLDVDADAATARDPSAVRRAQFMRRATLSRVATPLGEGRYRFDPVEPGRYEVALEDGVNPPALAGTGAERSVSVSEGAEVQVEIVSDRGGWISGRVLDDGGSPRANVWVTAFHDVGGDLRGVSRMETMFVRGPSAGQRVLSDGEGRFRIESLSESSPFEVRAEDLHGAFASQRDVRTGSDVTLRFAAAGALKGVARDASLQPLAAASIQVTQAETGWTRGVLTRPDGSWEVPSVSAGRVRLEASDTQGRSATRELDFDPALASPIDLVLGDTSPKAAAPM